MTVYVEAFQEKVEGFGVCFAQFRGTKRLAYTKTKENAGV
jgi:hypothetical protein